MKQLALDIGLAPMPTLEAFFGGPNAAALQHVRMAIAGGSARSPVPTLSLIHISEPTRPY